jgi:bifunctional UDP-N-acetylglucosamine pyrophosphorylase/glucosamine-1-phosphate N-acetyltransferase
MLQGVTVTDPNTTYIDASAKIGSDTVVHPFTIIEGDVRIGNNCRIGPFARLRPGTRVGDKVEIGNFTEVSRSKIGSKTFMKHFSYLGDSLVGTNVNIGAGVVTANYNGQQKNTTRIDDGAFIGSDSILVAPVKIGKRAVVGAGSVVIKGKTIPDGCVAVGVPARIISKGKRK